MTIGKTDNKHQTRLPLTTQNRKFKCGGKFWGLLCKLPLACRLCNLYWGKFAAWGRGQASHASPGLREELGTLLGGFENGEEVGKDGCHTQGGLESTGSWGSGKMWGVFCPGDPLQTQATAQAASAVHHLLLVLQRSTLKIPIVNFG